MLWLLFGQRLSNTVFENYGDQLRENYSLIPFHTISNYIRVLYKSSSAVLLRIVVINLVGNVVMLVPLGFFLPLNWQCFRGFWKCMGWIVLIIVGVELVQFVTLLGSLDVDDLILNAAGGAVGYGLWKAGQLCC